jgi:hypothetical protein
MERAMPYFQFPYTFMILPVYLKVFLVRGVSCHLKILAETQSQIQHNRICVGYEVEQNNKRFDVTDRTVLSLPRRKCGQSVKQA